MQGESCQLQQRSPDYSVVCAPTGASKQDQRAHRVQLGAPLVQRLAWGEVSVPRLHGRAALRALGVDAVPLGHRCWLRTALHHPVSPSAWPCRRGAHNAAPLGHRRWLRTALHHTVSPSGWPCRRGAHNAAPLGHRRWLRTALHRSSGPLRPAMQPRRTQCPGGICASASAAFWTVNTERRHGPHALDLSHVACRDSAMRDSSHTVPASSRPSWCSPGSVERSRLMRCAAAWPSLVAAW